MATERIDLLKSVALFSQLSAEDIDKVASLVETRHYGRDEVVLHQEDPGDALYVILDGRVKVVLYGEDGKEVILSTLRVGEFFGEMSLLDGKPRSATVVAQEDAELLRLRRNDFMEMLRDNPTISLQILSAMSHRLRMADAKIGSLALLDVYGRVARALREIAQSEGIQAGTNVIIERRPTHQDLAAMTRASRETVSRVIGDFVRGDLVALDGKRIILHDEFLEGNGPDSSA